MQAGVVLEELRALHLDPKAARRTFFQATKSRALKLTPRDILPTKDTTYSNIPPQTYR